MKFALAACSALTTLSPASGFVRPCLKPALTPHATAKAAERGNGFESALWDAELPLPFLASSIESNEGAPPSLRFIYLLPVSTALLVEDWPYTAITSVLLALAVSVEAPQWTALVGGALVAGSLGDNQIVTNGFELSACILVGLVGLANDWEPLRRAETVEDDNSNDEDEEFESNLWSSDAPPDEDLYENLDRLDIWDGRLRKKREMEKKED